MKNITAIERIAMQKTAIQKITAKITTTALLFFLGIIHLDDELKMPKQTTANQLLLFLLLSFVWCFLHSYSFYGRNIHHNFYGWFFKGLLKLK